ncbi:SRPBCC family protein [Nocardioides panacis]|uniref:SRPBCC family protein n=1 Tax=Nocardioides panacis TaxID=2849501 RepID=A0A975SYB7_9ACTN|nr:SRPBCC family protein [Nocardioides panacis]QWZ08204.1 SRPBCC family protein [Nocardioides panacis]
MDLNHSFTVPASVADTWKTFEDIESVAGCFPGATVTEVDGNDFKGTCKVKLGPIAMVYSGAGTFLEKDEAARRFVIEAKGKDKRGNGTAGATVTATFAEAEPGSTRVDVQTDLAITGKPAQFGRGVIEDISNKLLQQFVTCLQDKVGKDEEPAAEEAPATTGSAPQAAPDAAGAEPPAAATPPPSSTPAPVAAPRTSTGSSGASRTASSGNSAPDDDALDLGATVLPILARTYGPQAAIALVALVVGYLLGRRRG